MVNAECPPLLPRIAQVELAAALCRSFAQLMRSADLHHRLRRAACAPAHPAPSVAHRSGPAGTGRWCRTAPSRNRRRNTGGHRKTNLAPSRSPFGHASHRPCHRPPTPPSARPPNGGNPRSNRSEWRCGSLRRLIPHRPAMTSARKHAYAPVADDHDDMIADQLRATVVADSTLAASAEFAEHSERIRRGLQVRPWVIVHDEFCKSRAQSAL